MRHPGAAVLAALVAASGIASALPVAPAVAAADSCSVQVRQRVVVNAPVERIRATLGDDCERADVVYASWDVKHPTFGNRAVYIFDGGHRSDVWRLHDWEFKGRFAIDPSIAYDSGGDGVTQSGASVDVRYGSRLSLDSRRSGGVVRLTARATRYTSAGSRFVAMRTRRTFFATRACHTCDWRRIGASETGRFGRARLTVRSTSVRDYRAVMPGTRSVWGRTSRTASR